MRSGRRARSVIVTLPYVHTYLHAVRAVRRLHRNRHLRSPSRVPYFRSRPCETGRMAGSSAPLAGRVGEWAALRALVRDAGVGAASTLLVSGETGVGKTALLRQAESEPVRLLWASCLPLTSLATPLLPLRSLYAFDGGDPLTDFDAWLDVQTQDRPTLLVVDDIQWADHSTLAI